MFFAGGVNNALKLALRRKIVAQEEHLPLSYVVLTIARGKHARGVGRRIHERTENRCKETTNTETIRSIPDAFFEGR